MWLDLDRDGRRAGAGEVGLPSVLVDLYRVDLGGSVGGAGRVGALARAAAPGTLAAQVRTDSTGAFTFAGLDAGTYSVLVHYPTALAVTWDSEGAADAAAMVVVPEAGEAEALVGLAGDAQADLTVQDPDGGPVDGPVVLWWAGPDGVFGTDDDVRVPSTATAGRLRMSGLPAGGYRVLSADGAQVSGTVTLSASGVPAVVRLAEPGVTAPAVVAAAARSLAATGATAGRVAGTAAALLVAGLVLATVPRRLRSPRGR